MLRGYVLLNKRLDFTTYISTDTVGQFVQISKLTQDRLTFCMVDVWLHAVQI